MTRSAPRTDRRAARWPRLLLLAALLLGIVTMHTLGHPSRSHVLEDATTAAAVAPAVRAPDHTSAAPHDHPAPLAADHTSSEAPGSAADRAPGHTAAGAPGSGAGGAPGSGGGRAPGSGAGGAPGYTADRAPGYTAGGAPAPGAERAPQGDVGAGGRGPAVEAPPHGTGMDPMSVCLAVLGGFTLLVLGAGPAVRRDAAPLGGAARAPGRSGGPDPPSPRELLTRLAVLRV
ncbi:hypothetical protein [Streptomyces sp. NPDC056387]|uniref:hypothetical protein n=1 Tax=Streptomyces sp. NPDC056387 TaxID=3345803 RepID=UPI0035DEE5E7